jgi:CBS domain containing-hemolysin-like protein
VLDEETRSLQVFIESGYSKIPVYEESLDNIKGIIVARDLFNRPDNLNQIIREVIIVPDTKKSIDMLNEFLSKRLSFAVVIDEFGGTAGIITMEDLLEELLGEIRDEYDTDDEICKKVDDNTFVIGGKVEVDYINENLNLNIPQGDYSTLAGYITYHLGRIPSPGENVVIENYRMLILRSNQKKVELVKVFINQEPDIK